VTASASDKVGVVGVQFKVDAANLGAEITAVPYSITTDTTTVPNGSYAFTAVARGASC
jgi:Big-like domain-containing protein